MDGPRHNSETTFRQIADARYSRREFLKAGAAAAATISSAACLPAWAKISADSSTLTFTEIEKRYAQSHSISPGYNVQVLLRWGDAILPDAPLFNPRKQFGKAQARQFGYNNDFLAYFPYPRGSNSSTRGLLCINHEYTIARLMFSGLTAQNEVSAISREQVGVEMAAQGISMVEVVKKEGFWQRMIGGYATRRITATTPIVLSGPAAGHERLWTSADPSGTRVLGTFGNCAGGATPWDTYLSAEENFNDYFTGDISGSAEESNHKRYGVGKRSYYGWHRYHDRFDVKKEPNESNRFGWIVEVNPYDPHSLPVKRTALGRFKHECATTALCPDGRVAVYSGDDEAFEYVYRFVTARPYVAGDDLHNRNLLDAGTLSVARFYEDGTLAWLPLIHGEGPLTEQYGFYSQADVLIETRRAADLVGATPMDRPEDIEVDARTGTVYLTMTKNPARIARTDAANPRRINLHGHIISLLPPDGDHAANRMAWDMLLLGGDPQRATDRAMYKGKVSKHGWLSCPDNLALDPAGNLWITTDGQPDTIHKNDGLYAMEFSGSHAGAPRLFFNGPAGCEVAGPAFTPDGKTLFLSIQHPADEKHSTFDNPSTRWPDFKDGMPPRPSVIAITKKDGGLVGI